MTLVAVSVNGVVKASDLNQIINALTGLSNEPMHFDAVNNASVYAVNVRNQGSGSKGLIVLDSGGNTLLSVNGTGVNASFDGVAAASRIATESGTQTFTNKTMTSPVLNTPSVVTPAISGIATFTGRILWHRGTSTASAGSVTLPTDGNLIPITGTTNITAIAAVNHLVVCLEFASAGCKVTDSSTLQLQGDFISVAGSTLTLECDGTNWYEIARGNPAVQQAICNAAAGNLANNAVTNIPLAAATYDPYGLKTGNTLKTLNAGQWRVSGSFALAANSAGNRIAYLYKNGSEYCVIGATRSSDGTSKWGCSWSIEDKFAANDALEIRVFQDSGGVLAISTQSVLSLTFIGT